MNTRKTKIRQLTDIKRGHKSNKIDNRKKIHPPGPHTVRSIDHLNLGIIKVGYDFQIRLAILLTFRVLMFNCFNLKDKMKH
jgi:hypothetical protein